MAPRGCAPERDAQRGKGGVWVLGDAQSGKGGAWGREATAAVWRVCGYVRTDEQSGRVRGA
eukprot:5483061-Prymnesium_polylepis.1